MADDNRTLLQAAVAGLGVALLPTYIASEAIAAGEPGDPTARLRAAGKLV